MILATLAGTIMLAGALGIAVDAPVRMLPAGAGGLAGLVAARLVALSTDASWMAAMPVGPIAVLLLAVVATGLLVWGSGLERADGRALLGLFRRDRDDAPTAQVAPRVRAVAQPDDGPAPLPAEFAAAPRAKIVEPRTAPPSTKRVARDRQAKLDLGDTYGLPPLDLLSPPPPDANVQVDKAALERNARLLETVLDDFNVKGEITEVRPGPVVTMYELEPAAGIKASRVIGLADDIARNMTALSARVATIPGRTVIGIELPNAERETVTLSELIGSETFEDRQAHAADHPRQEHRRRSGRSPTSRRCRTCSSPAPPARASRSGSTA